MTEASGYLRALARRNAAAYAAIPRTKAVIVTGSVASGQADFYSDIDLIVYYDALPSERELEAARQANHGSERLWVLGDRQEGSFAEAYSVDGVECQVAHATVAALEQQMAAVLERYETDSPLQKVLSGILEAVPLYGEDRVKQWQAKIARYPDGLARAMVDRHLRFWPRSVMENMAAGRDDILWLYEMLTDAERNILGVLLGLNRVYHWGEYKRMDAFLGRLEIAPRDLSARLKQVLSGPPEAAVDLLCGLIRETFLLVESRMPELDARLRRERWERPRPAWRAVPSATIESG